VTIEITRPSGTHFIFTNWFAWIVEANKADFSQADILFVLRTVGVLEEMRAVLEKEKKGNA
jgi:hypothetical protein